MDGWLFSTKHLSGLSVAVVFLTAFFVAFHFFNRSMNERQKLYVLRVIAGTMIFLEFWKMVLTIAHLGIIGYGQFPFHLCSMPLVLYPLVAFGKEKTRRIFAPAAFIIGIAAGAITLAYPSNVLDVTIPWFRNMGINYPMHSFIYHTLMVVFAGYMIQSKIYKIKAIDFVYAAGIMLCLACIAMVLNALIPGADYFMLGHGYGMPTQGIIEAAGLPVYIITMMAIGIGVVFLIYSYWIFLALVRAINKKGNEKAKRLSV